MRVLALMSDAYGGFGGIAQFNRDQFDALSGMGRVERILSLPRHAPTSALTPPKKVIERPLPGSPYLYALTAMKAGLGFRPDVVLCGHANLLPVAAAVKRATGATLILNAHGIEIWQSGGRAISWAIKQVDLVLSVSRYTRERLLSWSGLEPHQVKVIFDTIHLEQYRQGPKPAYLIQRYGLQGKRVLLTMGRLSAGERYKGHDRVIKLLPDLSRRLPDLMYLIAGDGDDRKRLQELSAQCGVEGKVIFAGRIPDEEKIDHYNLADGFAMPSTGEGFGIVFLEAAACGLPVLGGNRDGSRDALVEGHLGAIVNPDNSDDLLNGLTEVCVRPKAIPVAIQALSYPSFISHLESYFRSYSLGGRVRTI